MSGHGRATLGQPSSRLRSTAGPSRFTRPQLSFSVLIPSGAPAFKDAQYYWEVGEDPKVQRRDFAGNWRNVDYVVSTPQVIADAVQQNFPIVTPALEHSRPIAQFNTDGWQVQVRRVQPGVTDRLHGVPGRAQPSCMGHPLMSPLRG